MSESWVVGIHPVAGVLSDNASHVRTVAVEHGQHNRRVRELVQQARTLGIPVLERSREQLGQLSGAVRHQGIAALYEPTMVRHAQDLAALIQRDGSTSLLLVLDGVTDPHNLGACLRSAAAAKATAVIVPRDRAAGLTQVARRTSAGGADRVPLMAVTNLARSLRALKDAGVWIIGLCGVAEQSLYTLDLKGPVALVLGSEGSGMRQLIGDTCDFMAKIPMPGTMESLNVSVVTGIALFEVLRQRGM